MRTGGSLGLLLLLVTSQALSQKIDFLPPTDVFEKAAVLSDSGNYKEAIAVLRQIDKRDTAYEAARLKMIFAYINDEQPDSALRITGQLLSKPSKQRQDYLRLQGIAMSKIDYKKSVGMLEKAVSEYPTGPLLRYSLAAVHFDNKQYDKATQQCFRILEYNPFYSSAHKLLSRVAMVQGHKTHAMMAMGIYLGTSPNDNAALVLLNQLADNQVTDEGSVAAFSENEASRLDQMIRAKIVMNDNFHSAFPINAAVVRQFELIFDQLNTLPQNSKDEYLKRYLGTYQAIKTSSLIEPFIYHILTSTSIEAAKKWRTKNEKELDKFYKAVNAVLSETRGNVSFPEYGFPEKTNTRFDNGNRVSSIGTYQNEKPVGHWIYLYQHAQKSAEGNYRPDGTKGGVWTYYHENGERKSVENMDTGEVTVYSKEGPKTEHFFLKNDKIDGQAEIFYVSGERNKLITYTAGKRNGKTTEFYANGVTAATYYYVQGEMTGAYELFYPNGKIKIRSTLKSEYYNGKFEDYYINGALKSAGEYAAGERIGAWKFYHKNGKINSEGKYSPKGKRIGEWTYHDHHGALTAKDKYDEEGRLEGPSFSFEDGKQRLIWEYKRDLLIKHSSYDSDGKVIFTAGNNNGTFYVKLYAADRTLLREGNYVQGKADGLWKYYNRYGAVTREYPYKNNELHGKVMEYYWNGTPQAEVYYEDGKRNGKYTYFSLNGKISNEVWYVDDNREQQLRTYFADGTPESNSYYINGEETGKSIHFAADGKPYMNVISDGELVDEEVFFNSKGTAESVKRVEGTKDIYERFFSNGKLKGRDVLTAGRFSENRRAYFPDGSVQYDYEMLNNKHHGKYLYYHPSGKLSVKGQYEDGEKEGIWERYRENGSLLSVGRYFNGEEDSLWSFYNDDNTLSSTSVWKEGERHGVATYYNSDGKIILEKKFRNDELAEFRSLVGAAPGEWIKFNGNGKIEISYPNGKPAWFQEYKNGLLHGVTREYFANGSLFEETPYEYGDVSGSVRRYHLNGKLKDQEPYKFDDLNGKRECFNDKGELVFSAQYLNSYLHGRLIFYEGGREIKSYNFWHGVAEQ